MANERNETELPNGYSFLALPDFGSQPGDLETTLERLNAFLKPINDQGARLVQLVQIPITSKPRPGIIGRQSEDRLFALIDMSNGLELL